MRVFALAHAFPNFPADAVARVCRQAWMQICGDVPDMGIDARGEKITGVACDITTALQAHFNTAPEPLVLRNGMVGDYFAREDQAVFDLTQYLNWQSAGESRTGGDVLPFMGNSAPVGEAVKEIAQLGIKRTVLNLPRFSTASDYGLGFFSALSAIPISFTQIPPADVLREEMKKIAQTMENSGIFVTCAFAQELTGFSGMARMWTYRGVSPAQAQQYESRAGTWIDRISAAALRRTLLPSAPGSAGGRWAGVGGGLGMMFSLLGVETAETGTLLWDLYWGKKFTALIKQADLVLYFSGGIGDVIPETLIRVSQIAGRQAIPLAVVGGQNDFSRGELPRLGISAYYPTPALFSAEEGGRAGGKRDFAEKKLSETVMKIAQTWSAPQLRRK